MSDRGALDELRLIFRGEVEDHVATLERESERIAAGLDPEAAAAARREIYRAVHTLKGAARAVELEQIERACDALEARLGAVTEQSAPDTLPLVVELSTALRVWMETDSEAGLMSGETTPAAVPESAPERNSTQAPDSAPLSAPLDADLRTAFSQYEDAKTLAAQTTRVGVVRLGELADLSEELLGLATGSAQDQAATDDMLAALRRELSRIRESARRTGHVDVLTATDRALATAQTLRLLLSSDRERTETWRRSIANGARDIADRARSLRVVPLSTLSDGISRATREAAASLTKNVALSLNLEGAEVDRSIRDALKEALLHLVRNAVDHGIEGENERLALGKPAQGRIHVRAEVVGRELRVVVEDDGRGLDHDALRRAARVLGREVDDGVDASALIFQPGLTTRSMATPLSGRGMGLDIVRQRIVQFQGRVQVQDAAPGTRFSLVLPVDVSVLRGLVVTTGETRAVLPSTAILRLRRVRQDSIHSIEGRAHVEDQGVVLPLVELSALLGRERATGMFKSRDVVNYAVVGAGERQVALELDALHDERELVVRPPGPRLRRVPFVAGVTILDGGDVAIVLDMQDLVAAGEARPTVPLAMTLQRKRALVVDDSITTRQLVRSILAAEGYDVFVAANGEEAWSLLVEVALDAVVSDIDMPKLDGFQLLARIRSHQRLAKLPVILVTALEGVADRQRASDLGASAYLVKAGFDQQELLTTLEELL